MCGIFGLIIRDKQDWSASDVFNDLKQLYLLSQIRGREATGLVMHSEQEISVVKNQGDAGVMLKDQRFSQTLTQAFAASGPSLAALGHCRLVTNGSNLKEENVQPIVAHDLIGIHNGIITNAHTTKLNGHTAEDVEIELNGHTAEDVEIESDTKILIQRISEEFARNGELASALIQSYAEIQGSASIALLSNQQRQLALATNTGSLYYLYCSLKGALVFASEKTILNKYLKRSKIFAGTTARPQQLCPMQALIIQLNLTNIEEVDLTQLQSLPSPVPSTNFLPARPIRLLKSDISNLKRCTRCILPHTYPFITFDSQGVCNFCHRYQRQVALGEKALEQLLDKHRSKDGSPDCLVGLSGGRDSCYGIHVLKTKYGMTPLAYTFDWGLTTDTSRRNQAKVCGKLGIEHIIRAPDIQRKRSNIRKNVHAFLQRPHLGMVPLFMAGDKEFYQYGRTLRKENNLGLTVFCAGHSLEQRDFMTGFCGVDEDITNNKRLYQYSLASKLQLAAFYTSQYIKNPAYINASFVDSIKSFLYSFIGKDDFLYLFQYLPWEEAKIEKLLNEVYEWEADKKYGKNQWRMGDGQTAFTNYIYFTVAGFTEFDNFRANQIREGMITRQEALELIKHDNEPKWDTLKYFAQVVGINLDEVLRVINNIPKLY